MSTGRDRRIKRAALAAGLALWAGGCHPSTPPAATSAQADAANQPQRLPTATLDVAGRPLVVEVAATEAERRKGMMFRSSLGPDEAMLFVFLRPDSLEFWMKDTLVDLDIAFLGADGTIRQIERMTARNLDHVFSLEAAQYALEVPAGWFAAHGVAVGDTVTIPPEVTARAEP